MKLKIKIAVITMMGMSFGVSAQENFSSINLSGNNPISSVNGFYNKIQFTDRSHGALVFNPGKSNELMFGLHSNGNFYWGTGQSASRPNFYSMYLNGNNGELTTNSIKIKGSNSISSVNGFLNKIEFIGGSHGALVFNPGKSNELMFGLHSNGNFYWGTGQSASKPNFYPMYLNSTTGNLGIRGKLTASEVKIKLGGWADFVFYEGYKLPTLKEVERHIKEKGHLKNIPSAKEVEKNGIFLGEMDAKLLQKIEELTLYTIEQEKKLKSQKDKFDKQQKEIENQRGKIERLESLVEKLLKDKN